MCNRLQGCAIITLFLFSLLTKCSCDIRVDLEMKRFATQGSSVTLRCLHSVQQDLLYKVEWLRADSPASVSSKFYQYIKGRVPPFRNFSIPGAEIDMDRSNERQVTLKNLDLPATGVYSCEVSLETPIYTKASSDHELTVFIPQDSSPRITFSSPVFNVGEMLEANCTSYPANPPPHITWLINGKKVDEMMTRVFPHHDVGNLPNSRAYIQDTPQYDYAKQYGYYAPKNSEQNTGKHYNEKYKAFHYYRPYGNEPEYYSKSLNNQYFNSNSNGYNGERKKPQRQHGSVATTQLSSKTSSTTQLNVAVSELHVGEHGKLELTCLATIPAFVNAGENYADYKTKTVTVDVLTSEPSNYASVDNMSSESSTSCNWPSFFVTASATAVLILCSSFV